MRQRKSELIATQQRFLDTRRADDDLIVFKNNTDYKEPIFFWTEAEFLEFANRYIGDPKSWGNLYSQEITGVEIEWSEDDAEWVVART